MRALTALIIAAAPLPLISVPAAAQSVIQGGRWVSSEPVPPAEPASSPQVAPAPATVPEARLDPRPRQPAPTFAPPKEVVQPLPRAATPSEPPVERAEAPPLSEPAPVFAWRRELVQPLPRPATPAAPPVERAEAPPLPARAEPGATYPPPSLPAIRRAAAPPAVVASRSAAGAQPVADRYLPSASERDDRWEGVRDASAGYPARVPAYRDEDIEVYVDRGDRVVHVDRGYRADYLPVPPTGYPPGGYIADGYYYPPAVTTTIVIHSQPVETGSGYTAE